MKQSEHTEKVEILKKLIKASSTGTPKELAKRLNTNERSLRRLIEDLKISDPSIRFSRGIGSYTSDSK
jgi:hypothetical protein